MTIVIWQPVSYAPDSNGREPSRASTQVRGFTGPAVVSSVDLSDFATLSPEMILYVAKKRMEDIDGQVRASMSDLEVSQADSKKIGEKIRGLRELQEHLAASGKEGIYIEPNDTDKSHNFVASGDGKTQTAKELLESHGIVLEEDIKSSMGPHGRRSIQAETIDAAIKKLEDDQRELNTGNELRMVKLQSLMQQRTQIVTLATNLLQKLDEGAQAITRNLA